MIDLAGAELAILVEQRFRYDQKYGNLCRVHVCMKPMEDSVLTINDP